MVDAAAEKVAWHYKEPQLIEWEVLQLGAELGFVPAGVAATQRLCRRPTVLQVEKALLIAELGAVGKRLEQSVDAPRGDP